MDAEWDGVTVKKGLDLTTEPLPAIKFAFESERDSTVGIRLTEQLPDEVTFDHVAVHTDHGGRNWTAFEDGRLVFTGAVSPGETVITLFMVWLERPEHVFRFLTEPYVRGTSDPNAPSLRPVGVETTLRVVDGSFTADERFADVRADVARSLGESTATSTPDSAEPALQITVDHGTTAWPHPVHRVGNCDLDRPTTDDLEHLAPEAGARGDHFVRVETRDTYHGGGAVVVVQELANAFDIRGRRVIGEGTVDVVEAVIRTDQPIDRILTSLAEREQVSDVLVSPLFESDAPQPLPAPPGTMGPDTASTFEELQSTFDPVDAAELEAELDAASFPELWDDDDLSIDELLAAVDSEADSTASSPSGDSPPAEEPAREGRSDDADDGTSTGSEARAESDVEFDPPDDDEIRWVVATEQSDFATRPSTWPDVAELRTGPSPVPDGESADAEGSGSTGQIHGPDPLDSGAPTTARVGETGVGEAGPDEVSETEIAETEDGGDETSASVPVDGPPAWGRTFEPFADDAADSETAAEVEALTELVEDLQTRLTALEAELEEERAERQTR
ncbi:hypothetical protein [Haloarchaeobius sp. TZWWS8]|uniref:hypothetical protein n=1 Tax=Haloarchaeobius sp. TZWWS8 TaxID=3446121 RepID=UPI003EBA61F6